MTQPVATPVFDPQPSAARVSAHHHRFLDALRGYAIAGVVIAHLCYAYALRPPGFLIFLGHGVTLFYVLSAYCLMLSLSRSEQPPSWKKYFVRRFFRIAPAFYIAIALWSLAKLSEDSPASPGCILASIAFVNGWIPPYVHSAVPHGWSIGVEMSFYVILPLLYSRIRDVRAAIAIFLLTTPLCVAASWCLPSVMKKMLSPSAAGILGSYTMYWPISEFPVFVVGIVAYFITYARSGLGLWLRSLICRSSIATAASIVCVCLTAGYLSGRVHHLAYAVCFGVLVVAMSCGKFAFLDTPIASAFGSVSFGVYLFHQAAINLTKAVLPYIHGPMDAALALVFTVGGAVAFGWLSYMIVERPGVAVGRAMSAELSGRSR